MDSIVGLTGVAILLGFFVWNAVYLFLPNDSRQRKEILFPFVVAPYSWVLLVVAAVLVLWSIQLAPRY